MTVALAAAALAAVALMVSVSALRVARDHRRASSVAAASPLRVSVTEGQARRALADDTRDYALLLSLGNESTAPIVVSACQLRVTYRTRANFLGAVDLEPRSAPHAQAGRPVLEMPVPVLPGRPLARWVFYTTANVIPRHCRVQDYALMVWTDAGTRHVIDASLPSLLAADTDGQGPATWGWD